jgi:hypothetical protein
MKRGVSAARFPNREYMAGRRSLISELVQLGLLLSKECWDLNHA